MFSLNGSTLIYDSHADTKPVGGCSAQEVGNCNSELHTRERSWKEMCYRSRRRLGWRKTITRLPHETMFALGSTDEVKNARCGSPIESSPHYPSITTNPVATGKDNLNPVWGNDLSDLCDIPLQVDSRPPVWSAITHDHRRLTCSTTLRRTHRNLKQNRYRTHQNNC